MDDCKGTVKAGKNAELVVIEGNPDEDIYVMRNRPRYVFFRGEVIENPQRHKPECSMAYEC